MVDYGAPTMTQSSVSVAVEPVELRSTGQPLRRRSGQARAAAPACWVWPISRTNLELKIGR